MKRFLHPSSPTRFCVTSTNRRFLALAHPRDTPKAKKHNTRPVSPVAQRGLMANNTPGLIATAEEHHNYVTDANASQVVDTTLRPYNIYH